MVNKSERVQHADASDRLLVSSALKPHKYWTAKKCGCGAAEPEELIHQNLSVRLQTILTRPNAPLRDKEQSDRSNNKSAELLISQPQCDPQAGCLIPA